MDALINRDNHLLIRKYLDALREDCQLAEATISRYKFYLRHLLLWAMATPFSQAHNIKPGLLIYLDEARSEKGEPLAAETRKKIVENARKFFEWCRMEQATKFRSLPSRWVQKLKFQRKNAPDVQKEPEFLLVDEVIQLASLPTEESDLTHWRDRAMVARLFLTGERASAAVTSPSRPSISTGSRSNNGRNWESKPRTAKRRPPFCSTSPNSSRWPALGMSLSAPTCPRMRPGTLPLTTSGANKP